ncbi:hypothetical protein HNY73_015728 [Argiope bruennichi]|uniref:Uncharacterized protein n=1 Tax=Argiope bruennichi TaxID=94029 RepID=A0A8T0EGA7_ARGBR|nr:hypothetical protein HNY73_015728 [Argiope bruennichi]
MESDINKTDREHFADDSDILTDDENLFYSPKGAGMIIPDTPTPIKGFKGLTYKDFKKSSDSDSNEIIEPSMQTDSKMQMATKRKKKNVKMKTGENLPKDKRPCIPRKGKEKERNDGIANAKKAKNVDASENEIPEENKQPFGPLGILETFENIISKYRIEGNAAEELRDLFLKVLSNSSATKMNSTDDNHGPTFANVVKNLNSDGIAGKKIPLKPGLTFIRRIQASKKLLGEERNQIQQKIINANENDNKTTPLLRPKANLPTLVVRPITESIDSSIKMRKTLEANISPKGMEIKIMGLKPAMGNGVLIQVETPEMVTKLKDAINSHTNLQNVCKATTPQIRMPQIIIYDVEKSERPREEEELDFLNQIKLSNDIVGNMRVLFRKKGRGSSSHWAISLNPKAFRIIKDKARLQCGFGSYRFREFVEPLRCFKCLKFGHVRSKSASFIAKDKRGIAKRKED